jgi:hypothetical protein
MSPQVFELNPIFLQSGNPETEDVDTLQAPGTLGARFTVRQPSGAGTPGSTTANYRPKRYQLVRTDSTMATPAFANAVAMWSDQANYLVTTAVANRGMVAGRFCRAVSKVGNYCCIQIGGWGKIKFVDAPTATPTAAGLMVIPSATAGKADCLAAGTAPTYDAVGRSVGVYDAAQAECLVDIGVPETV